MPTDDSSASLVILDGAPTPALLWEADRLVHANPAARRFLHLDPLPQPPLRLAEVVPVASERERLRGGMPCPQARLRTPTGRLIDVAVHPRWMPEGRLCWWLESKEEAPSPPEERAHDAHQLETFSLLAGGIAHDINNLLVAVIGNAEVALSDETAPVMRKACLSDIAVAARQAGDLGRQLLVHAGSHRAPSSLVDPAALLREAKPLLGTLVGDRAQLLVEASEGLPAVVADVSQLRQVLMNLAGNAADALETLPREERGPIRIVARAAEVTPEQLTRARPQALAPGAYLAIDVIDEGPGLAPAIADGLFTPWTTTKSHGHGLGLATSGAILKRHGGGILVDSQPTRTCFTVLLPTSVPTMLPAAEATHTLLFVDPSPLIRRFAVRCLALHRYRVLEAADVQAASALLADHKGVDAVVIDIDASVESHRGPVEALRQLHPALPLIAMGGLRDEVVLTHLRSLRVEQFLLKPFTPKSLLREVEWALARRR